MAKKLTVENLLGSEGFIRYPDDPMVLSNYENVVAKTKSDIYEDLHKGDPIKTLKEFGMFGDKDSIKYEKLEYTGIYKVINEEKYARYLLSRTCVLDKEVHNNSVTIGYNEIYHTCPLYYLTVCDVDGKQIDESLFSVQLDLCEHKTKLQIHFDKGYIKDDNQDFYDIYGKNKNKIYKELINCVDKNMQYIVNDYTDSITINFNPTLQLSNVKIEYKVYDVYGYGGFFSSGWLFL
jgi:hypothetical protein